MNVREFIKLSRPILRKFAYFNKASKKTINDKFQSFFKQFPANKFNEKENKNNEDSETEKPKKFWSKLIIYGLYFYVFWHFILLILRNWEVDDKKNKQSKPVTKTEDDVKRGFLNRF